MDPRVHVDIKGVDQDTGTPHNQEDVDGTEPPVAGALEVEHAGEDETKWETGDDTNERNKLVKIVSTDTERNSSTDDGHQGTDKVLAPLVDPRDATAALGTEKAVLDDVERGPEHEGGGKNHGNRVKKLDGDGEGFGGDIGDNGRLNPVAVGNIAHGANQGKDQGDDDHTDGENSGKLLGMLHAFNDGNDCGKSTE